MLPRRETGKLISAASGPKFTILWGYVENVLLLKKFFPLVDSINQSIRALMQVDKPHRDRVNEYVTVLC